MVEDPYYWHFDCPASGLTSRADLLPLTNEQAEPFLSLETSFPKIKCEVCGEEHDGYLKRSKFGKK